MTGRPSIFTAELGELICSRIAGGESLRTICASEEMPDKSQVFRWLGLDAAFRDQYAIACEARTSAMAEEILEIADDGSNDTYEDDEGRVRTDHDVIARSRLRVDTRKWLMARMSPKKYGDRVEQVQSGNPDNPVQTVSKVEWVIVRRDKPEKPQGEAA